MQSRDHQFGQQPEDNNNTNSQNFLPPIIISQNPQTHNTEEDYDEFAVYDQDRVIEEDHINPLEQEQLQREHIEIEEEEENIREEGDELLRENRAQVLARMLRSYYVRMRSGMTQRRERNDSGDQDSDERATNMRRPRSRIGLSRINEESEQNTPTRLNRWSPSPQQINTMSGLNNRLQSEDDQQQSYQSIENYFHRRSEGHPPRYNASANVTRFQDEDMESITHSKGDYDKIKSLIPDCWYNEISSEICKSHMKILELYGPLAMLLYTRIEKLSKKDSPDMMFDLCLLNLQMDGMKFVQRVLAFFSNNMRESTTNIKSKRKIDKLIKVIPSTKSMIKVFQQRNEVSEREKLIFKVVVDILDIYYKEFDGPTFKNYRRKVIPLGLAVYGAISNDELKRINNHIKIQSIFYRSFTIKSTKEEYIAYYEEQQMNLSNLVQGLRNQDFEL